MIKEHERVVLTTSVPHEGLEVGDVGTVVHVYRDGLAYEVEVAARLDIQGVKVYDENVWALVKRYGTADER